MSTNYGPQGPQQPPWGSNPPQTPHWMQPPISQPNWHGQQGYPVQQPPPYGYPQGYPPPMMQPPPTPPKKKAWYKRPWGIVLIIFLSLGICGGISNASHGTSTDTSVTPDTANSVATSASTPVFSGSTPLPTYPPTATPKPTQAPSWHTIQTFSGNGAKKTATVSVPDSWRISWACTPDPLIGSGLLYVGVYNSDGTMVDLNAVGTDCKAGNTSGNSEEHQAGQVYLDINSGIDWTIKVETFH